ncbi:MAG: DUF4350 domain-containing protein [Gammaproteobacteria bacterium]
MLLVVAAAIAVIGLADRHIRVIDVSRDARNSLTEQSAAVLELLSGLVDVHVVIPPDAPVARAVADFFARYQRHKADFDVHFVDPKVDLEQLRQLAANPGEIVIRHGGRSERLTELSEAHTTNALARLARGTERYITFLSANGERQVTRDANHDLTSFGRHLKQRGLAVHEFALDTYDAIPDNTAVLVIASPAVAYTVGELDAINRYVARGGNLLWLSEPDQPAALSALGRALGVEHLPGTIVDPIGLTKLRNPAYAVAVDFASHAVTEGFNQTLALPFAAALAPAPNIDWQATAVARTGPEAWTETGPYSGNVGFDADDEVRGALTLVLALSKSRIGGGEQRVIIVGDGDFLSNAFVANLGNQEFGRRLIEWLAADDALIDIAGDTVPDGLLDLALWQRVTLFLFFAVALPLGLAANGALYWWRRRHA